MQILRAGMVGLGKVMDPNFGGLLIEFGLSYGRHGSKYL